MIRNAKPIELLTELNLKSLVEVCKFRNIENINFDAKRKKYFLDILEEQAEEWSNEETIRLIDIYKKQKNKQVTSSSHIFKSSDLQQKQTKEIFEELSKSKAKVVNENKVIEGFDDLSLNDEELDGTFKGQIERIMTIGEKVLKESHIISLPFSLFVEEGCILIKGNNLKNVKRCREFIQDNLSLKQLCYSIPEGIRDEGANIEDYNGRANDFVKSLGVEEVNGVFLKIGGKTKINRVDYRGKGDILNEREIKTKIRNKALMNGIKGYIRYKDLLIDFTIKWNYYCFISVKGEGLSNKLVNDLIKKIYRSYKETMLK
jgi:hypothetical protein